MTKLKIYLASSWRNPHQAAVLALLRAAGHEVYDFKNPAPGNTGFSWRQVDPDPTTNGEPGREPQTSTLRLRRALAHPVALAGFEHDFNAMKWADVFVLLLPCGMSAHLEAGWAAGFGKPVAVLAPEIREPELMYKIFESRYGALPLFETCDEVIAHLALIAGNPAAYGIRL